MYQTWIWHFHRVKILSCTRFLSTPLHYDPGAHHQAWNSCTLLSSPLCECDVMCFYWNGELSRNIIFRLDGMNRFSYHVAILVLTHSLDSALLRYTEMPNCWLQSYRRQECHGAPWVLAESTATAQFWFLFLWLAYELTENNITSYHKVCNRMLECIWYFLRHFAANPINVPSWTDSSLHPAPPGSKAFLLSHPVETGLLFICLWHREASKPWNGTFLLILVMSQRSQRSYQEIGGGGNQIIVSQLQKI